MLKKSLQEILSKQECEEAISSFDQIGDIIIIRIPDTLLPKRQVIGQILLNDIKIAKNVFCQTSAVSGDFRTRNLELIAGNGSSETIYKEFGCRFRVDVKNAFFSPRLSTERERIAGLVSDGETVVNMFGGVGMFSVMAAKRKKCTVYSIDINPVASRLCEENARINKMCGTVIPVSGDARTAVEDLKDASDRTLMLLPEESDAFLDAAIQTTRDGGMIHYYSHTHADKKSDAGRLAEKHLLEVSSAKLEIIRSKRVRPVGPRYYQTVVDVIVCK